MIGESNKMIVKLFESETYFIEMRKLRQLIYLIDVRQLRQLIRM